MNPDALDWQFSNPGLADVLRMVESRLCSTGAGEVLLVSSS